MFEDDVPEGLDEFRDVLRHLRRERSAQKEAARGSRRRKGLRPAQRAQVLAKTGGRCPVCGGTIEGKWQADHVMPHSQAGDHSVANYLPAHRLCNNYRWDYGPDEFQLILKLGVWARTQVERGTGRGQEIGEGFLAHERQRANRRVGG